MVFPSFHEVACDELWVMLEFKELTIEEIKEIHYGSSISSSIL